jgi:cyclopropane-fatty-acyl-phospholipid synthase
MKSKREIAQKLLNPSGVVLDGPNPWDPKLHDERVIDRLLAEGPIAVGESYMDGWWDVEDMAGFTARVMDSDSSSAVYSMQVLPLIWAVIKARVVNLQSKKRAFQVGEEHYDIGNDLYERMLDKRLTYSCGYWSSPTGVAKNLDEAQEAKLDLICRKIGLKKGDRVLDIGCGWGSFAIYAAEKYGAKVVGVTVSKEQAALARERAKGLPVEIRLQDYRAISDGPYDHVVSVGMFEHVGYKNYRTFFELARKLLKEDGLFLLHTIGAKETFKFIDPWLDKYIFPNGYVPSAPQITTAADKLFILEDWHNFGADYETTLLAWDKNFERHWPELKDKYSERFYRMWKFYLLSCAGSFRARNTLLWQIVLSPKGVKGGYVTVR